MLATSIHKILKNDEKTSTFFIGVFARDRLPNLKKKKCCLVLNTDSHEKPGEHWLAIYVDENGFGEFFDSYANNPERFGLINYLNKNCRIWTYNKQIIQGNSNFCGYYCVLFLLFRARNKANKFFSYFNSSLENNDLKIKKLIN